jgi:hypothetical protein
MDQLEQTVVPDGAPELAILHRDGGGSHLECRGNVCLVFVIHRVPFPAGTFCQKLTERFLYKHFYFNGISLPKAFSPVFPLFSLYFDQRVARDRKIVFRP